jgi:hypothetical protein
MPDSRGQYINPSAQADIHIRNARHFMSMARRQTPGGVHIQGVPLWMLLSLSAANRL